MKTWYRIIYKYCMIHYYTHIHKRKKFDSMTSCKIIMFSSVLQVSWTEMLGKITSFQSSFKTCSVGDVASLAEEKTCSPSLVWTWDCWATRIHLLLPILTLLKLLLWLSITVPAEQFSNCFLVISCHHYSKWTLGMYADGVKHARCPTNSINTKMKTNVLLCY